ncbi:MAG TPA: Gfo/Idh/MocA family oxidoreductase [Blastocatellia bacterium]|jgi:predicted dehydrogenase|nr:Gfo/Idh/MocA family oxidoreductase [Blastocatellia bacterium]
MIRAAVIGAGHFGREHARVYADSGRAGLVAVCDINESNGRPVAERHGASFVTDYRELVGEVDAVSLAVPTVSHHSIACELLRAGVAVLVEKPISRTLEEADEIIAEAERNGAVLQIGHLERFNPALIAAARIATKPRFFEAHRLSVFTPRSLDIDVVMDLMIHDIDVVLSLVESDVIEVRAAGVPILTPRIDIANARIEFENGCVANLTASRVSSERIRKLRFFQPHEYVSVDYSAQEAATVAVKQSDGGRPLFESRPLAVGRDEPLRLEIESFLSAVGGARVEVGGLEGRRALALAVEIVERIREHAARAGVPFAG